MYSFLILCARWRYHRNKQEKRVCPKMMRLESSFTIVIKEGEPGDICNLEERKLLLGKMKGHYLKRFFSLGHKTLVSILTKAWERAPVRLKGGPVAAGRGAGRGPGLGGHRGARPGPRAAPGRRQSALEGEPLQELLAQPAWRRPTSQLSQVAFPRKLSLLTEEAALLQDHRAPRTGCYSRTFSTFWEGAWPARWFAFPERRGSGLRPVEPHGAVGTAAQTQVGGGGQQRSGDRAADTSHHLPGIIRTNPRAQDWSTVGKQPQKPGVAWSWRRSGREDGSGCGDRKGAWRVV